MKFLFKALHSFKASKIPRLKINICVKPNPFSSWNKKVMRWWGHCCWSRISGEQQDDNIEGFGKDSRGQYNGLQKKRTKERRTHNTPLTPSTASIAVTSQSNVLPPMLLLWPLQKKRENLWSTRKSLTKLFSVNSYQWTTVSLVCNCDMHRYRQWRFDHAFFKNCISVTREALSML